MGPGGWWLQWPFPKIYEVWNITIFVAFYFIWFSIKSNFVRIKYLFSLTFYSLWTLIFERSSHSKSLRRLSHSNSLRRSSHSNSLRRSSHSNSLLRSSHSNSLRRSSHSNFLRRSSHSNSLRKYKVVQIWPGQTVTCLHTNRPGHIWTTLYIPACQNNISHLNEGKLRYLFPRTGRRTSWKIDEGVSVRSARFKLREKLQRLLNGNPLFPWAFREDFVEVKIIVLPAYRTTIFQFMCPMVFTNRYMTQSWLTF